MHIHYTSQITSNLLLEVVGPNGEQLLDTNKFQKYKSLIGDAVIFQDGEKDLTKARRICFESKPFLIEQVNDKTWESFDSFCCSYAECNWDKASPIKEIPLKISKIEVSLN